MFRAQKIEFLKEKLTTFSSLHKHARLFLQNFDLKISIQHLRMERRMANKRKAERHLTAEWEQRQPPQEWQQSKTWKHLD